MGYQVQAYSRQGSKIVCELYQFAYFVGVLYDAVPLSLSQQITLIEYYVPGEKLSSPDLSLLCQFLQVENYLLTLSFYDLHEAPHGRMQLVPRLFSFLSIIQTFVAPLHMFGKHTKCITGKFLGADPPQHLHIARSSGKILYLHRKRWGTSPIHSQGALE